LRSAGDWHDVISSPLNLPYNAAVWLLTAVLHHGVLMTRVVAAACGVIAGLLFFVVLRLRYSFFIALLGTIMFTTSTGFLHATRFGSGGVLQMSILALIAGVLAYQRQTTRRTVTDYALVVLLASLWYVPGLIWFELLAAALLFANIRTRMQQVSKQHLLGWVVTALVVAAPLLVAIAHQPQLALSVFGLPHGTHGLAEAPSNLLHAVLSIGVRSDGNPLLWVGHMPLLSVTECLLGLLGVYVYLIRSRSRSGLLLAGDIIISLILISLNGGVGYASLVPLLYLYVVAGLSFLLGNWLSVFPRNPIARSVGVLAICAMLGFSVLYQVRSYFVAWPHHTATRQAFRLPQP
jgi:hypothetical protein